MHTRLLISSLLFIALLFPAQNLLGFPLINRLFDLLHFPCFFILGILLSPYVSNQRLLVILILSAALIELIQPLVGRSADAMDLILGISGVINWYLYQINFKYSRYVTYISITSFSLGTLLMLSPQINALLYKNQFGDFSVRKSSSGWRNIDNSHSQPIELVQLKEQDKWVLKGKRLDYPWSGASYDWAMPYNYNNTLTLSFNFYSDKSDFELDIKLTTITNKKIIVSKTIEEVGWKNIQIPLKIYSPLKDEYIKSLSIYYDNDVDLNWYFLHKVVIK